MRKQLISQRHWYPIDTVGRKIYNRRFSFSDTGMINEHWYPGCTVIKGSVFLANQNHQFDNYEVVEPSYCILCLRFKARVDRCDYCGIKQSEYLWLEKFKDMPPGTIVEVRCHCDDYTRHAPGRYGSERCTYMHTYKALCFYRSPGYFFELSRHCPHCTNNAEGRSIIEANHDLLETFVKNFFKESGR